MILAIVLFTIGLALSAFFSGSETGMYRVSRIRLVLDALSGSLASRGLVWLLNNPAIFIATALVGNNLANYLTSLATVLAVQAALSGGAATELLGTILMTPVIFVLGELLPKYLFYNAPYRLLRRVRPLLLVFTVAFLPISLLLGLLGRGLQRLTGETPFRVQLEMARRELEQVLREGQEAGILAGGQRTLAQNVFQVGNQPAVRFGMPLGRLPTIPAPAEPEAAKAAARRHGHPIVLVQRDGMIEGFLLYSDLVTAEDQPPQVMPVVHAQAVDKHLAVLMRLYEAGSHVALLADRDGRTRNVVTRRQLLQPLIAAESS